MTDSRICRLTVFTIAFGMAVLASNQAIPQSAAGKKMRIKAANEKKKADAAAKKTKADAAAKKTKADAAAEKAKVDAAASADSPSPEKGIEAEKAGLKKKLRDWHAGDQLPEDYFGRRRGLRKNYDPDSPARAAQDNEQPAAEGTYEYLKRQVWEIKLGQQADYYTIAAVERRQRAVDNLKALGPAAGDAVPALVWSAMNERDAYVKRRAIEILGDIGGMLGMVAVSETFLQPGNDPETAKVAEDALLKLLTAVGRGLKMNDAIFLLKVYDSHNERVATAIDSAWAASGITQDDIARAMDPRAAAAQDTADAKAEVTSRKVRSKIQALCVKLLQPGNDPETAKAAEDSLLKLLSAVGGRITPRDCFFLYDVRRFGNPRLSRAIEAAWEANGFTQYFMAKEQFDREHPRQEEEYAATHRGKKMRQVRDMPEQWARWMMTPHASSPPDFAYWLRRGLSRNEDEELDRKRQRDFLEGQGRLNSRN